MAYFLGLANELKDAIIAHVPREDLSSLSQSCKWLRHVVLPELLRSITMTWDADIPSSRNPKISFLLRALQENPSLVKYVKQIHLHQANYSQDSNGKKATNGAGLPECDGWIYDEAIKSCGISAPDAWIRALHRNELHVVITLLMFRCTHLESLEIDFELLSENEWLHRILQSVLRQLQSKKSQYEATPWQRDQSPNPIPFFDHLHTITVAHKPSTRLLDIPSRYSHPNTTSFFYLPHLTTLTITIATLTNADIPECDFYDDPTWPLPSPPLATTLTTLTLLQTQGPSSVLTHILAQTPNLKTLVYEYQQPSSHSGLTCFHSALLPLQQTLQSLTIRFTLYADEPLHLQSLPDIITEPLGPLTTFTALRYLNTSLAVLIGQVETTDAVPLIAMLPPDLQTLIINDDLWEFEAFPWNGDAWTEAGWREFLTGERLVETQVLREGKDGEEEVVVEEWIGGRDVGWGEERGGMRGLKGVGVRRAGCVEWVFGGAMGKEV